MSVKQNPNNPMQPKSPRKRLSVLAAAAALAASALFPMQQAAAETGTDRPTEPVALNCDNNPGDPGSGPVMDCDTSLDVGDSPVVDVPAP